MEHWIIPDGPASSLTRTWVEFRARVREAAARWCDNPTVEVEHSEPECVIETETSCTTCIACEASHLVAEGLA